MAKKLALALMFLGAALTACAPPPSAPPPAPPAPPPPVANCNNGADCHPVTVYFSTDRNKRRDGTFGSDTNTDKLQFGEAVVTIPTNNHHTRGVIEHRFELLGFHFRKERADKDFIVVDVVDLNRDKFMTEVKNAASSGGKEVFVFVHGFNVSFGDGIRRTAQLKEDLPFAGPAILYSWPSNGRAESFTADLNLSLTTTQHLEEFLRGLAALPTVDHIHILAHSMGSRPLMYALYDLRRDTKVNRKIKNVILAAPEIPQVTFNQIASVIKQDTPGNRYAGTLYVSSRDRALGAAEDVDRKLSDEIIPRLGDAQRTLYVDNIVTTIDATAVDTDFLGHSYYGDTVVPDIGRTIQGLTPEQRGLTPTSGASGAHWVIQAGR